jgi:hypothetical protein
MAVEFYGTRYQSGSFFLINVGSGFHCLCCFSLFHYIAIYVGPVKLGKGVCYISVIKILIINLLNYLRCKKYISNTHTHTQKHTHTHTPKHSHTHTHKNTHTHTHTRFLNAGQQWRHPARPIEAGEGRVLHVWH